MPFNDWTYKGECSTRWAPRTSSRALPPAHVLPSRPPRPTCPLDTAAASARFPCVPRVQPLSPRARSSAGRRSPSCSSRSVCQLCTILACVRAFVRRCCGCILCFEARGHTTLLRLTCGAHSRCSAGAGSWYLDGTSGPASRQAGEHATSLRGLARDLTSCPKLSPADLSVATSCDRDPASLAPDTRPELTACLPAGGPVLLTFPARLTPAG